MNAVRVTVVAVFALVVVSCSTMRSDSGLGQAPADLIRPEVTLMQLSGVPAAARHVQGGISVNYRIQVANKASEPITLKNVTLLSMGRGAYEVPQTSRPFSLVVKPDAFGTADFWIPATADASIMGVNGPVTLRIVAHFDSPVGQFDQIVIQQVGAMSGQAPAQ